MIIRDLVTADALPALEATMRFAEQRQSLIAHNIANFGTPDFRPLDVDPGSFQKNLAEAVDRRRAQFGGVRGELPWRQTRQMRGADPASMRLRPEETGHGPLYHDRTNRSLEHILQDLVENEGVFRTAAALYRSRTQMLGTAISLRV
jgi:flagellar basal body rod protein FlgB